VRDLVALGVYSGAGLSVAGEVMPRLPGSVRAVWSAASSQSAVPLPLTLAQEETAKSPFPLDGGVRIFEWNGVMIHAKTAVADGRWARVGSTNANITSWFGNWELDVAIEDEKFGAEMQAMFDRDVR